MKAEVQNLIEVMIRQTKEHVPDDGDFAPILELFPNPDNRTLEFVGKYGLKIYKMPKDVVADSRHRYVEAVAYIPSGQYKSDCVVALGTKNEVLAIMQSDAFVEKLCQKFVDLAELFEYYD